MLCDIADEFAGFVVVDECADGNFNGAVVAGFAVHFIFSAGRTIFCAKETSETQMAQGVETIVANEDDVSAPSAVAAVRSAGRRKHFARERGDAVSAFTGCSFYFDFIDKSHKILFELRFWN